MKRILRAASTAIRLSSSRGVFATSTSSTSLFIYEEHELDPSLGQLLEPGRIFRPRDIERFRLDRGVSRSAGPCAAASSLDRQ
ncbi:MAG: hypothetical protein MZU95_00640 [Desulfomicrobium escambiense]|nr:hypothetical protein [Desulfomicrobium escambiense]